jgi:heat shock protein HslJ
MLGVMMVGLALIVTACASEAGASGGEAGAIETGTGGSLVGKSYLSLTVTEDGEARPLVADSRIRLDFRDDGVLMANAGCNRLGGYISTDGGRLSMDGMGGTEIGCGPAMQAQEVWLERLLLDDPTWKLEGDLLTITRGSTTVVLQDRKIAEPDKPLEGTKWVLESVMSGQWAFEHFPDAGPAYFTIRDEGIAGSTGCNDFQGSVTRTGASLTIGELRITLKVCTGRVAELERALLSRLKGKLTYSIDSNRLELRTPDGMDGINLTTTK